MTERDEIIATCIARARELEGALLDAGWTVMEARHGASRVLCSALLERFRAGLVVTCPFSTTPAFQRARATISPAMLASIDASLEGITFTLQERDGAVGVAGTAVDPSIIDALNEGLARADRAAQRARKGTVYTPGAETTFMSKLALARELEHQVETLDGAAARVLVFDGTPPGSTGARESITRCIDGLSILDPACGSGSFLVAMARCSRDARHAVNPFTPGSEAAWRARFVTGCLHGFDTDPRAVEGARLRTWCWVLDACQPGTTMVLPSLDTTIVQADFLLASPGQRGRWHDIVIGNPPYIRQEDVGDACYKRAALAAFTVAFPGSPPPSRAMDYYVYFFLDGMAWVRPGGTVCLLTANAWLDARYGKDLQRLLLEHGTGITIIEHAARCFDQADVNTTITLARRAVEPVSWEDCVRFVTLQEPLAAITGAAAGAIVDGPAPPGTRVVTRAGLLREGTPPGQARENLDPGGFQGGKWRAMHLAAPEAFHRLVDAASHALVPLGIVAEVRTGCYTGLNAFFYLDQRAVNEFGIEPAACTGLLRSARSISHLAIDSNALHQAGHVVFHVPAASKVELAAAGLLGAVRYIEWGERQRTTGGQKTSHGMPWPKVTTLASRKYWYALPATSTRQASHFMQYIAHDRFYCPRATTPVASDRCFHRLFPRDGIDGLAFHGLLNSTIQALIALVSGRSGLGGGALKLETTDARAMLVIDPRRVAGSVTRRLHEATCDLDRRPPASLFNDLGIDPSRPVDAQEPDPRQDRLRLDVIACEVLGIDPAVLPELHRATCAIIKARLDKARKQG